MGSSDKLVIIKYNAGNIQSVLFALERIGKNAIVTDDHDLIRSASKVIFPGVGEASSAMKYLKERGLDQLIKNLKQPVLGICLGMQLMCGHSEENDTDCLGIFNVEVKKIRRQKWFFRKYRRLDGTRSSGSKAHCFMGLRKGVIAILFTAILRGSVIIPFQAQIMELRSAADCQKLIFLGCSSTRKKVHPLVNSF